MKKSGITLLEVMIYVVLAGMAALAVGALFTLGRSAQKTTLSGYLVSGEADTALRWIRRDLQETALVSIRVFPNAAQAAQPPGCSFTSSRDPSDKNPKFNNSQYGKPLWTKHVFYSLKPDSDGRRGDLIRWERPLTAAEKDYVPRAATLLPNSFANTENRRVLLRHVLLPNQKVGNLQDLPNYQTDKYGGFRVQFVQRIGGPNGDEQLTEVCPGDTTQPQPPANVTRLVAVRLQILADDNFRPDFYQLEMRMCPRF